MNTRRYPRTADEAFKTATYAGSIYRYAPSHSFWDRCCWLASFALIAGALSMAWWWK